jgi:hypothetical protein
MIQKETRLVVHCDEEINASYVAEEANRLALRTDKAAVGELALDPLTVAVVVGATYAVTHLIVLIIDRWRGGTVLDLGIKPPAIRRDRSVPVGVFVVVGADGEVEIHAKDLPKDGLERIVEKLLSLGELATKETVQSIVKSFAPA